MVIAHHLIEHQPRQMAQRIPPASDGGSRSMLTYAPMASVTYFVVVVFDREDGELRPGEPQEVRSAEAARRRVALTRGRECWQRRLP